MKALQLFLAMVLLSVQPVFAQEADQVSAQADTSAVVAKVLGQEIRENELVPEKADGATPEQLEQYKKAMLTSLIFGRLIDGFIKENNIETAGAEVKQFVQKVKAEQEAGKQQFLTRKADIEKALNDETLDAAGKEGYQQQLEQVNTIIKQFETVSQAPVNEDIAKEFIKSWKINQALYAKYGGRVIFQQAGPEPLDAYKGFLKEHEAKGDFVISDPKLKEMFWDYFVNDSIHTFLPEEEAKRAMTTSWWVE